ncbi:MAG: hypothetical protein LDL11_07965 [Desulfarculus sp.]|nr:hypothetical protein [Desulfarculus sp.]
MLLLAALLAAGCIHVYDFERLKISGGVPAGPPTPVADNPGAAGLAGKATGLGLALAGIGLAGRRWLRLRRQGAPARALDREDLALIRTARDALIYLLRKRFRWLGVAILADHRRWRGGREF